MRNILVLMLLLCTIAPLAAAESAAPPGAVQPSSSALQRRVSIDIKDTPLKQTLDMLFKDTDISYRVDPDVADLRITAVLKGVPIDTALQEILRGAGAVYARNNDVYHIMAKQPAPTSLTLEIERKLVELTAQLAVELRNKKEGHADVQNLRAAIKALEERLAEERKSAQRRIDAISQQPSDGGQRQASLTRLFTIEFINPAELVPLVYALGARQVTVVSGGKLVINGTDEVIAEAEGIIRQLDTEEALPRPVRVKVSVSYVLTNKDGPLQSADASMEGTAPDGQPIKLKTNAQVSLHETFGLTLLQETELTPVIGPYDRITLTGSLKVSTGQQDGPLYALSESQVAISTASGKPSVIGSGALTLPGTIGYKLEYEITAIATIGEGRLRTRTKGGGFNVPGVGNFGGYGGASLDLNGVMDSAATQWNNALGGGYGEGMGGFGAAMDAAMAQLNNAFGGYGGSGSQDAGTPDCSSGGGGL